MRNGKRKNVLLFGMLIPKLIFALPESPNVVSGEVGFAQNQSALQVTTTSEKAIIEYSQFNIAPHENVQFNQPDSQSAVLNRVTGIDPSNIQGSLKSNGQVFLVNPHGVFFGPSSQVNVGSLIVSTLDIKNQDFLNDQYRFFLSDKSKRSLIRNEGFLQSEEKGVLALFAPEIENEGYLCAHAGSVLLGSGEAITLDFLGDGKVQFAVEGEIASRIEQSGVIEAALGQVWMEACSARKVVQNLLQVDDIQEANQLIVDASGAIYLGTSSTTEANEILVRGEDIEIKGACHVEEGIRIVGNHDITLDGCNLTSKGDMNLIAGNTLKVRDGLENPLILLPDRTLHLRGEKSLDILALSDPYTAIASGGDMILASQNLISADAHFSSGGEFGFYDLFGDPSDFTGLIDPIISGSLGVIFGSYTGVSLKIGWVQESSAP